MRKKMKETLYYMLLVLAVFRLKTVSSGHSQISRIDHLSPNLIPLKHDLKIYTDFENEEDLYHGDVRITIRCIEETSNIVLNMKELLIIKHKMTVNLQSDEPTQSIWVEDDAYDSDRDQYTIILNDKLKKGLIYEVFIPFKKEKMRESDDIGYLQYDYTKGTDEPKKIIAVTIADVNDARRIFPCFDSVYMKTTFNFQLGLLLNKKPNLKGISSLKFVTNKPSSPEKDGWTMASFEESLQISTYSFAFLVANLESKTRKHAETEVFITVWADESVIDRMESTLTLLLKVFNFYFEHFGSKPSINELHLVALPNFHEMKTEKSGLILLEESTVLPADPSNSDSESDVILRLCYEVNRQWIGAGATMLQWNEYWLDIALSTFLRESCFKNLFSGKTNNYLDLELVETFTRTLRIDGESISRPVQVDETNFDLTEMFTNSILSDKAYLIIRTMNYFFGDSEFHKGVKKYFNLYNLKNSSLDQVWEVFNEIAEEAKLLPPNATVKTIMESWTSKKGYALVTMERDFTSKKATLKQSRFVQLEDQGRVKENYDQTDYRIIPLSYATKTQLEKNEGKELLAKIEWLKYSISISPVENEMILVNVGMKVLCRVLYDKTTQELISNILHRKKEFGIIDYKTRAHLICDMFALAGVGKLEYETLFSTMTYLKHENSDFPLMVALYEFNVIRSALFGLKSGLFENYQEYVKQILTPIFNRKEFATIHELPNVRQEFLSKKLVIESACTFQVKECISLCKDLFAAWRLSDIDDKDNLIPESIRETVFCQAIKHGGLDEFEFLWHQFHKNKDRRFNEIVLTGLGCFNQDEFLEAYLRYSILIDKEMPKYSLAIISGFVLNDNGYQVAKKFFISRLDDIINRSKIYKGIIGSFLIKLFDVTNTIRDFNQLHRIMADTPESLLDGSQNLLKKSIERAKRNSLWKEKHEAILTKVLRTFMYFDTSSLFEVKFQ